MELARALGMSAAQFQATRASQPLALPDGNPNTGGGGGTGLLFGARAGHGSGAASSSGYGTGQPLVQRSRGGVPHEAVGFDSDPYSSSWRGNSQAIWTIPADVARQLWTQDSEMTDGGKEIEDDAMHRVTQARQNEDGQRLLTIKWNRIGTAKY